MFVRTGLALVGTNWAIVQGLHPQAKPLGTLTLKNNDPLKKSKEELTISNVATISKEGALYFKMGVQHFKGHLKVVVTVSTEEAIISKEGTLYFK